MVTSVRDIDIKESELRQTNNLLDILLIDRTTNKNIIWATDSYQHLGTGFATQEQIKPELVTGKYNTIIQPRAAKSAEEQRRRTKDKAEVFTPLWVVEKMNDTVEPTKRPNKNTWQAYVRRIMLEITCGEAPFIVSRYDPTAHTGKLVDLNKRVGFLDKKLKVVSKYCDNEKDWLFWAKEAFKASYGYEWQGDNILIARENLLYTFIDYYKDKFGKEPTLKLKEEFAEVISWNIFQMDGLKYVIPMSCRDESKITPELFGSGVVQKHKCGGCTSNTMHKHNGVYVNIMDWEEGKVIRFVDLVGK